MLSDQITKTYRFNYKVITQEVMGKITDLFSDLFNETKSEFPDNLVEILYLIRTGNGAYSGPSLDEFTRQFQNYNGADYIQVVIQATNITQGVNQAIARITLTIDRADNNTIEVIGEKETWINGIFNRFKEILEKEPNRHRILHNVVFEMSVQLLVVLGITMASIYYADKLKDSIRLNYSSVYIFIVLFLLLSNIWTYVSRGLLYLRNKYYPKVDIRKMPRKRIILGILSFIGLAIGYWAINFMLNILLSN